MNERDNPHGELNPTPPERRDHARPRPPRRRKRGFFRAIFGFFTGLIRLIVATAVFFVLLVLASYYAFAYYVRGTEILAPDLTARPLTEALQVAKRNSLSIELSRQEPSETMSAGEVLSQTPRAGARIKKRTPIRVVLSTGKRRVTLPENLIGQTRLQASIRLRDMGFVIGAITRLPTVDRGDDVVLALDPPAGTGAPPGSSVHLLVTSDRAEDAIALN